MTDTLKVIFICKDNSCRSQMAESWTNILKRKQIKACSAGIHKFGVNPIAMRVMDEMSIDITDSESKAVSDFADEHFDFVITLSEEAKDLCPKFKGKVRFIHHPFRDPREVAKSALTDEDKIEAYRIVRDQIRQYVEAMPDNLFE